jgi:hypothetical protein
MTFDHGRTSKLLIKFVQTVPISQTPDATSGI